MNETPGPTVMLVDDSKEMRTLSERFLSSRGFRTVTADNGTSALEVVKRARPDLILLDVMMPGLNGYQVCQKLQQDPETAYIPVIFVTGLDEEQDRVRAFRVGAVDYLVKPFDSKKLLEKVRHHLDTRTHWYTVRTSTELWDETPLPDKFNQFRSLLIQRLQPSAEVVDKIMAMRSSAIYTIGEILGLTEADLAQSMSDFLGLQYLPELTPGSIQLGVLPTAFCRANHVVATRDVSGGNAFVISNPFIWDLDRLDVLNRAFRGVPHRLLLTQQKTISALFFEQTSKEREGPSAAAEFLAEETGEIPIEKLATAGDSVSPVQVVQTLISDAVRKGASDLHIEPEKGKIRVRYRIDGRMRVVTPLQVDLLSSVVGRIKILCGMDVTETRKPQDGGYTLQVDGRKIELRASSLPGVWGERIVLRILGENAALYRLDAIGMEPDMLRRYRQVLTARQGMVLITGPTGSGKTSTLYASLNTLNTEDVNILTVEDPVEADLDGIGQVQVHDRAGRSFANTLRSMLRQDPDIIMVGEIRDQETAEIGCRAALTGHLVLSTLHTQNTLGTLARLYDMGIPPYLVGASLNAVSAQRLIRRVCAACAAEYDPPPALKRTLEAQFGSLEGAQFRKGAGCARCYRTGTRGRTGVFELLVMDDDFRRLLAENGTPSVLKEYAYTRGFRTLAEDAFRKARVGLVTPEEVIELGTVMTDLPDEEEPVEVQEAEEADLLEDFENLENLEIPVVA